MMYEAKTDNNITVNNKVYCTSCIELKELERILEHPTRKDWIIYRRVFVCETCGKRATELELPSYVLRLTDKMLREFFIEDAQTRLRNSHIMY